MNPFFLQQFIFARHFHAARHVLFWTVAGMAVILLHGLSENNFQLAALLTLNTLPVSIVFTYGLLLWLIPRYLIKGRYGIFLMGLLLCAAVYQAILVLVNHYVLIPMITGVSGTSDDFGFFEYFDWYKSMPGYAMAATAVFFKMFKYWYEGQLQQQQSEKEKINAELQLLKAQLHPHFLFNTLNNLYTLVYEKSEKAPEMLLRLSGILSYVLYECKADEVLLTKEISIIKNYIALEQERYGERLDVSFSFAGISEGIMIVPMLFQPFIENAFKHGSAEQLGQSWMSVDLSVRKNELIFKLINSCEKIETRHAGGIGINNVKKRLELLYPGRHTLSVGMENEVYVVCLMIQFNSN